MNHDTTEVFGVIYKMTHTKEPARVRYIGQTKTTLQRRLTGHWGDTRRRRGNSRVQNFLLKYEGLGQRAEVRLTEIWKCYSQEELDRAEIELISAHRAVGQADLNISDGGGGGNGIIWTEEARERVSKQFAGENSPRSTFTWEEVNRLRSEYLGGKTLRQLVEETGRPSPTLQKILGGHTWKDETYTPLTAGDLLKRGDYVTRSTLTLEQVKDLRKRATKDKRTLKAWAEEYGTDTSVVGPILRNVTYRDENFKPIHYRESKRENFLKLTPQQVREIRETRRKEYVPSFELGRKYGVGESTINKILSNKLWRDEGFDPESVVKFRYEYRKPRNTA